MAARPARESGATGMRSISCPKSLARRSPARASPLSSSSHSCQRRKASMSCWSARRELLCRTDCSSRARVSFSSCQYSFRTASSPMARSSHWVLSTWRWSRSTVRSVSSGMGNFAPPGISCPDASDRNVWDAVDLSSSASCAQALCWTASQAPFTLRALLLFIDSTRRLMRPTKAKQPSGCPPTVLGVEWQVATSCVRRASTPARNSLRSDM
mmetsp:Transcript_29938/g.85822  ORF Transcript_29938/g.85822 Transcript_29938/m.85822 type:complete len:212 (-) Transcript_29938:584-1219(-)